MYIVISIFLVYTLGIISYEYNFFIYYLVGILVILIYNTIKTKKFIYNIVIILFLILAHINCVYTSVSALAKHIDDSVELIVEIKSENKLSNENSNYKSYNAIVFNINSIKLESKENTIIYIDKEQYIKSNSIVKLTGNVAKTNFSKNNLLFNYQEYLRSRKIHAIIFCDSEAITIKGNYSFLNYISINFREYTENLFKSNLKPHNADIMLSIILGDVDYLENSFYDNIKEMGLAHIFAVSGSHIVLLYGALLEVFKLIGFKRRISWILTWSLIWFYGFLIGFPLSVMRALVMFTLIFGSEVLYRRYNSFNSIALASLILTIVNPFWIFDAGFLLSFSAALSLIIYSNYIQIKIKTKNKLLRTLYMYLFLQVFMLPVSAYYFNYVPIMGIIYNIILLPFFTYILIVGFVLLLLNSFISILLLIPFKILDISLTYMRLVIELTQNFAFNGIVIRTLTIYEIIFFYIFIFLSVYLYNRNNTKIGSSTFIILISFYVLTYICIPWTDNGLYFNVLDAGQGLFTTVSYRNLNFIFDCGSTSNKNMGKYMAVPYLIKRGITNIDAAFISHWDMDHYSGIYDLISSKYVEIRNLYSSECNEDISFYVSSIKSNDYIKIDNDLSMKILWPEETVQLSNVNNSSLVILIEFDGKKIMLPGDIEQEVEALITDKISEVDIVLVPHHGSKTSSGEKFVKILNPKLAVFSYGKNNYGIPSEDVIKRYMSAESTILSTFEDGEINIILKNGKLYYNTYMGLKSENFIELYLEWMMPKMLLFFMLLILINYRSKLNCNVIYKLEEEVYHEL